MFTSWAGSCACLTLPLSQTKFLENLKVVLASRADLKYSFRGWDIDFCFLMKTLHFQSSFRFAAILSRKCRDFPYTPAPHIHSLLGINIPHQSSTFVTADEPTLSHHSHPKATVYILGFISVVLDKCIMTCLCHYAIREYFHCLKNPLCCACSSLPHPPLATTDFTVSIVLPFLQCYIVGIIQYVAFSDWLLSLSLMHLKFFHVFSWLSSSYLLSAG